ncbi:MAG: serine protease [Proteobacteria bacterium]|nr:serine protease [Pseudomonadota bacterium]
MAPLLNRFAVTLFAVLCAAATASAEPGLRLSGDAAIPSDVASQEPGVLQLIPLDAEPWIVTLDSYESTIARVKDLGLVGNLITDRIRICTEKKWSYCDINTTTTATAFLAKDQTTLWSVRHNFDRQLNSFRSKLRRSLDAAGKAKALDAFEPAFLLYDSQGNLLFDTRAEKDFASFELLGNDDLVHIAGSSKATDVVSLKLSRPIDRKPLPVRETYSSIGDATYILGFPMETKLRETQHSAPDSDGRSYRVSIGKVLDPRSSIIGAGGTLTDDDANLMSELFVLTDADGVPGQSGGPIVDTKGNVIGVFSNHCKADGRESPADEYCPLGGFGVTVPWMNKIGPLQRDLMNRPATK